MTLALGEGALHAATRRASAASPSMAGLAARWDAAARATRFMSDGMVRESTTRRCREVVAWCAVRDEDVPMRWFGDRARRPSAEVSPDVPPEAMATLEVVEITTPGELVDPPREPLRWLAGEPATPRQATFARGGSDPTGSAGLWQALQGFGPRPLTTSS